jgi:AraC-like DNA-binding protein
VNKYATPVVEPLLRPLFKKLAVTQVADLIGFWTLWHLEGGFEGLERIGMHRSTIFRKVKRFRAIFGVHPDEYTMPGVTLDPSTYWSVGKPRRTR